jgi:hypothetical protein
MSWQSSNTPSTAMLKMFGSCSAHLLVRRQHEHADAALAAHRIFRRAARVARRGAEDVQLVGVLRQRVFEQIAQQLHRHVLEGQGRAVRQALQDQRAFGRLLQHAQRRDLRSKLVGARVLVHLAGIRFRGQRLEVVVRNIRRELAQDLVRQLGIRQLAPGVEFGARHLRVVGGQIQPAVRRQAAQQDVGKGLGITCCGRARRAGGHILHTVGKIGVGWRWTIIIVWTGQYCLFAEYCSADSDGDVRFGVRWARGAHPTAS